MFDDYNLDYTFSYDYNQDLEDSYDLDEDYERDSHDYQELSYRYYA